MARVLYGVGVRVQAGVYFQTGTAPASGSAKGWRVEWKQILKGDMGSVTLGGGLILWNVGGLERRHFTRKRLRAGV